MSAKSFVILPVSGPLDTANPSTNRTPGTLLKAIDVAHRWIGPRRGGKIMTWVGRLPSSIAVPPGQVPGISFDGTNTYVKGILAREQTDLTNRWTCDVAFHAFANRAVNAAVPVFQWKLDNSIVAIEIGHYGSSHAQAGHRQDNVGRGDLGEHVHARRRRGELRRVLDVRGEQQGREDVRATHP